MNAPAPPSGWYPDPQGPPGQERWWDSSNNAWGDWTRPAGGADAPPSPMPTPLAAAPQQPPKPPAKPWWGTPKQLVVLAVVGLVGAMWLSGSLDEPLSSVGLQTQTCAENLFGNKMCGDELVAFCKQSYDADINADVCDPVLRDEGIDPASIAEEEEETEAESDRELSASFAETEDDFILDDLRGLERDIELCHERRGDYSRCRNDEQLGYPSATLGGQLGQIEIVDTAPDTFTVIARSDSGNEFTVRRTVDGIERTCTSAVEGARCQADGTWTP